MVTGKIRLFCLVLTAMTALVEAGEKPVVLGIREFLSDLPAMVADAQGYYAAEGLKVLTIIVPQGKDAASQLSDGTLDLAMLGNHMGLEAGQESKSGLKPPVGLACLGGGGRRWRVMVPVKSGIKNLEDLRGRRLGVWISSYGFHLLAKILKEKKIQYTPVKISMEPARAAAALEKGKVDAVLVWEPVPSMLEASGAGREIFTLEGVGAGVPVYLLGRAEFTARHQSEITKILRALERANLAVRTEPKRWAGLYAARMGLKESVVVSAISRHEFRVSLTCAERAALEDARVLFKERAYNKDWAKTSVVFDTAPLREYFRNKSSASLFTDNCAGAATRGK